MDTTTEAWVNGDRVTVAHGPFDNAELARQAMADGAVVPLAAIPNANAFKAACLASLFGIEKVEVTVRRVPETGQETDADLFVERFIGVREESCVRAGRILDEYLQKMTEIVRAGR